MKGYTEWVHDIKPFCTGVTISSLDWPEQLVEIEMSAAIGTELG